MSFEGQYLTFAEYRSLGGTLSETPFNLLEYEVRKKIDARILNRLKNSDDIPEEVKLCEFNLINSMEKYDKTDGDTSSVGNIKSENIDGYSISYTTTNEISEIIKSKESEVDDIITTYLTGVIFNDEHLIYCGVK